MSYSVCARFEKYNLNDFRYTGDTIVDDLSPNGMHISARTYSQSPLKEFETLEEAKDFISNLHINYRAYKGMTGTVCRRIPLTQECENIVDVCRYYIYNSNPTKWEEEQPLFRQRLLFQRTNGELVIFIRGIQENYHYSPTF